MKIATQFIRTRYQASQTNKYVFLFSSIFHSIQCRCTSGDLERMASIIASKLGVQMETAPTTPLTFLHIFFIIFERAAIELNMQEFFDSTMIFQDLVSRLEILACEASCASMRASELALVLICTHMDEHITKKYGSDHVQVQGIVDYAIQLQQLCKVSHSYNRSRHSDVTRRR